MSLLDSLRQIRFKQNSIKYHADRIETNMKNAIDAVIDKGKYTATGEETIDDLPSLIDGIETTRRYPNGTEWTNRYFNMATISAYTGISDVEYGNGMWVAGLLSNPNIGGLYSIDDGKTWNNINITLSVCSTYSSCGSSLRFIKYANNIWVGVAWVQTDVDTPFVAYSEDGINWEWVTDFVGANTGYTGANTNEYVMDIMYENGTWLLVTTLGLYYSADGKTWNSCDISNLTSGYSNVLFASSSSFYNYMMMNPKEYHQGRYYNKWFIYSEDKQIWIGFSGYGLIYSYDGITWYESDLMGTAGAIMYLTNFVYANGIFIASTCKSSYLYYSTNGINWNIANVSTLSSSSRASTVLFNDGIWVCVNGQSGKIFYSNDGIIWNSTDIAVGSWPLISYYNNRWFVTGCTNGVIYHSYNGINWFAIESESIIVVNGYNSGLYFGLDLDSYIIKYSTDCITWTSISSGKVPAISLYLNSAFFPTIFYKNGILRIFYLYSIADSICWEM